MKKRVFAALLLMLLLAAGAACALELPSNAVFSPGLVRLAELEDAGAGIHAEAKIAVDKAMYARDLSVLGDMLQGTTFVYDGSADGETLCIEKDGTLLGTYLLPEDQALDALADKLAGTALLERVPLASIAAWLEGLREGDALFGGLKAVQPFVLERTMSDDGERLTKIVLSGAIDMAGETWRVSGFMRQPAGRAPKDTFEIILTRDEKNTLELLYSALRENEVTRKNREGTASVRTTLRLVGKMNGYGVSSRLNVTMKNRWTADGEKLMERVSITASLTHQDNTPGRRYQRLNSVEAENKHVIRLATCEGQTESIEFTDEIALDVTMDGNAMLAAGADISARVGGDVLLPDQVQDITPQTAKELAAQVYARLDPNTLEMIQKGL